MRYFFTTFISGKKWVNAEPKLGSAHLFILSVIINLHNGLSTRLKFVYQQSFGNTDDTISLSFMTDFFFCINTKVLYNVKHRTCDNKDKINHLPFGAAGSCQGRTNQASRCRLLISPHIIERKTHFLE